MADRYAAQARAANDSAAQDGATIDKCRRLMLLGVMRLLKMSKLLRGSLFRQTLAFTLFSFLAFLRFASSLSLCLVSSFCTKMKN